MSERQPLELTIHCYTDEGFSIEIPLTLPIERIAEACKRLQAAGLHPRPIEAQRPPAQLQQRPVVASKAQRVRPEYNSEGTPICPEHGVELREGRYGLFCSGKGGQHVNDKGYCNLKFEE